LPCIAVFSCVRFFTAPLRALSPVGLLTATCHLLACRESLILRVPGMLGLNLLKPALPADRK
jgi:hypothetical protein